VTDLREEPVAIVAPATESAPDSEPVQPVVRSRRTPFVLGALALLLVALTILAGAIGAYHIPLGEVIASVLQRLGLDVGHAPSGVGEQVLWEIRFPRVVLTMLVGGSLACAGALMQGTFRNPLADPGIIGISSGAALGAVIVIALGISSFGTWSITVAAFFGGLLAALLVYGASRSGGRTEVVTLILTGIAVNAFTGALIGLMMFFSDDAQIRSITFWMLGSTANATWSEVAVVAPLAIVGILIAPRFGRSLDLLALGEGPAGHLGVPVERLRLIMIAFVAVLTAAAVAVAGIIAFVGLVIPHLVRTLIGPSHRNLIIGSALAGAAILVGADLVARTIAAPAEVPLGVLTALVGSPFFFWQLRRTRARQGGWG
jgi:iron complex transport system permease protein